MKLNINIIAALLCATVLITSCIEDKGNYDYTDANAVAFDYPEGFSHDYQMLVGDTLRITPPIETTEPYSYEWWLRDASSLIKYTLIGSEKTLKYRVGGEDQRSIMLRMKNDRTGVYYDDPTLYTVAATNTLKQGFLFLTQKGADIGIDMYAAPVSKYQPEYTLAKDVHKLPDEEARLDTENSTGVQLVSFNNITGIGNILTYTTLLLTDKGCWRVGGNFANIGDVQGLFATYSMYNPVEGMIPSKIISVQNGANANTAAGGLLWNGNWFNFLARGTTASGSRRLENAVNIFPANYNSPVGNEIPVSDMAAVVPGSSSSNHDMMMMWSDTEKKFLVKVGGNNANNLTTDVTSRWLVDANSGADPNMLAAGGSAVFNAVEPGRTCVWIDTFVPGLKSVYAVVKDPAGYSFLRFAGASSGAVNKDFVISVTTTSDISDPNDLDKIKTVGNQKLFAATTGYLYYATTDNEIHSLHYTGGELSKVPSINIPAGHEVVGLKAFFSSYAALGSISQDKIYVVTKDPSLPEDSCCTLTVYTNSTTSSDEVTVVEYDQLHWNEANQVNDIVKAPMVFPGLGNVIDFTWKQQ